LIHLETSSTVNLINSKFGHIITFYLIVNRKYGWQEIRLEFPEFLITFLFNLLETIK